MASNPAVQPDEPIDPIHRSSSIVHRLSFIVHRLSFIVCLPDFDDLSITVPAEEWQATIDPIVYPFRHTARPEVPPQEIGTDHSEEQKLREDDRYVAKTFGEHCDLPGFQRMLLG